MSPGAETFLGVSPSGVEWVVYPRDGETPERFALRVQKGRERLAVLTARTAAKAAPKAPVADLARLRARYDAARREVFRLLGQDRAARARGRYARAWDRPEYVQAYDRLQAARKALRAAERQARKAGP